MVCFRAVESTRQRLGAFLELRTSDNWAQFLVLLMSLLDSGGARTGVLGAPFATAPASEVPLGALPPQNAYGTSVRDLGITVLSEGDAPIVDIVFVHGIQGHPYKTWKFHAPAPTKQRTSIRALLHRRAKGADSTPGDGSLPDTVFWPKDLLADDFANARILTYGYDSRVSHFFRGPANQNNISGHGRSLLNALELHRRDDPKRPIIFIVHSLGGIVLKEARFPSLEHNGHNLRAKVLTDFSRPFGGPEPLVKMTKTFGMGSSYAKIGLVAEQIAKLTGFDTNAELLRNLKPDGAHLELLREEFSSMLDEHLFKVYSFQEGQGWKGTSVASRKVVDDASSSLDSPVERKDSINANHMMMCRFSSREDDGYIKLKGAVGKCLQEVQQRTEERQQELNMQQNKLWKQILNSFITAGIKERESQIDYAHEHTFDWIFTDPAAGFQSWMESDHGIFWIKGKPGSGKSTLMKYILQDPRTPNGLSSRDRTLLSMPAFFFHDRGQDIQKSFIGLLRAVLYQLLYDIPALTMAIDGLYTQQVEKYGQCDWPLSELEGALRAITHQQVVKGNVCMFIDALDEYEGRKDEITRFLKTLVRPSPTQKIRIRICASSREWNTFNLMLSDNPHLTLQDWTVSDIKAFASDRIAEAKRDGTDALLTEIVDRAEGVFLWVKLVIDELWEPLCNGNPTSELISLLSDLPDELPNFYHRMLGKVSDRDHETMMIMLALATSPFATALTLDEFFLALDLLPPGSDLPEPLKLVQTKDKVRFEEMRRRVKAYSGGLLEVPEPDEDLDGRNIRVQFIHQTAKSFVQSFGNGVWLDGKTASDISFNGAERIMTLLIQLLRYMDKTRSRRYFRHWVDDIRPHCPEEYPHFDQNIVWEFIHQAFGCQRLSRIPSQALLDDFRRALTINCGPRWLETLGTTCDDEIATLSHQEIALGTLAATSYLEFLMRYHMIMIAEREIKQNKSKALADANHSKLMYYAIVGNGRASSGIDGGLRWLNEHPSLWQKLVKLCLEEGCNGNDPLTVNIAYDKDCLMTGSYSTYWSIAEMGKAKSQDLGKPEVSDNTANNENVSSAELNNNNVDSYEAPSADNIQIGYVHDSEGQDSDESRNGHHDWAIKEEAKVTDEDRSSSEVTSVDDKESRVGEDQAAAVSARLYRPQRTVRQTAPLLTDMRDVTPLHLALAISCTYNDVDILGRIARVDMVRALVEGGTDATQTYENIWNRRQQEARERTAVHYLLYRDSGEKNPFDDPDLSDALSKCIMAFIDHGLDPAAVDSDGKSILECAIPSCPPELIGTLLEKGAKITPSLLTDDGSLLSTVPEVLKRPRWKRPEVYTPEARKMARRHNPEWAQERGSGLFELVQNFSSFTAKKLRLPF
ncbi:Vegetative incompatibility protein [Paramyrothecium foliicola]|nr:Vegetative incompatibility protein [Paramyrothecium foliicola]